MRWRKRRNLYLESEHKSRVRLFAGVGVLVAVLVAVGFQMLPLEQPSRMVLPPTTYADRFSAKKAYRQSLRDVVHRIKSGDTLYQILVDRGVQYGEVETLIETAKSQPDFQRLRAGETLEFFEPSRGGGIVARLQKRIAFVS